MGTKESIGDSVGRAVTNICSTHIQKNDFVKIPKDYNVSNETSWCSIVWHSILKSLEMNLQRQEKQQIELAVFCQ